MDQLITLISENWHAFQMFVPRVIAAVLVLFAFYYVGSYLAKLVISLLRRSSVKNVHEAFFRALTITFALFIGVVIALNILGLEKFAISLLAGGGATAIVLGFAFREIGENFLAGIFLAFSRPFKLGDLIKTEEIEGYVKEFELRYTHLRTEDGRDVYVPSSQLFSKPVTNFTKDGLRRISFSVGIDYADNAMDACLLLKNTCELILGVLKEPKPTAFIMALAPQYVELQVFFWINVFEKSRDVLSVQTEVMDKCRKALLEHGYTVSADTTSNVTIKNNTDKLKGTDDSQ